MASKGKSDKTGAAPASDNRLKRSAEQSRLHPQQDRAATEARETQDGTRFETSVDDWDFDRLPPIPEIPGFRTIWLSTTHPQDTIPQRMRLGYTPIAPEEVSDVNFHKLKVMEGEYSGLFACNEMVAFKLPEELWQRYMTHFHHTKPIQEEEAIRELVEKMESEALTNKGRVMVESGMRTLGSGVTKPKFH